MTIQLRFPTKNIQVLNGLPFEYPTEPGLYFCALGYVDPGVVRHILFLAEIQNKTGSRVMTQIHNAASIRQMTEAQRERVYQCGFNPITISDGKLLMVGAQAVVCPSKEPVPLEIVAALDAVLRELRRVCTGIAEPWKHQLTWRTMQLLETELYCMGYVTYTSFSRILTYLSSC